MKFVPLVVSAHFNMQCENPDSSTALTNDESELARQSNPSGKSSSLCEQPGDFVEDVSIVSFSFREAETECHDGGSISSLQTGQSCEEDVMSPTMNANHKRDHIYDDSYSDDDLDAGKWLK